MALDSDISNADTHLHVEFYTNDKAPYKDRPFVKIIVPGDQCNIIDQPVRDDHKERFPRQWLYYQMQNNEGVAMVGIPLAKWHEDKPEEFNDHKMAELQVLKFQTVEQVATASDAQMQRVGMGGVGMREQARAYLLGKNQTQSQSELAVARKELDELKTQMAALLKRKVGRPRKEA